MSKFRNYCFTINNYTDEDLVDIMGMDYKYVVCGFEIGKEGTPHVQGYVQFKNQVSFEGIKSDLKRAHISVARGSPKQNFAYCTKDGDYWDDGDMGEGQGKRTDMTDIKRMIDEGWDSQAICEEHFSDYIRYNRGIEAYRSLCMLPRAECPTVEWVYGPTGCGKTRYATNLGPFYIKDHTQWWNGYTQQGVIVIDDFDGRWPFRDLLRLLDRYPYQGQTKGGYVHINSPSIIITCDRSPEECMHELREHELAQLLRRISKITLLGSEVAGSEVSGNTNTDTNSPISKDPDAFYIDFTELD